VAVTMDPNSDSSGFVDGSFYNTGNPPPILDPNSRHITFADGTVIEYAEAGSTFTFTSAGPLNISCQTATETCSGDCTIKAPNITLDGAVHITKTLTVDGASSLKGGGTATPKLSNSDGSGGGS